MAPRPEEPSIPADWTELRALGHRMVDDMMDYLEGVRERPVWRPVPAETTAALDEPTPRGPTDPAAVYQQFREHILPYPNGNIHPRFWGWVMGTGTPLAMLADMLASGMNAHLAGYDQSPAIVERQVIRWMAELLGFPAGVERPAGERRHGRQSRRPGGGAKHPRRVRRAGRGSPAARARRVLVFYGSRETHSWARKASELMGLGDGAFRRIPVNADYQMDVAALRAAIAADRAAGCRPFCVIGNAGTVNTGATDDLRALAAICREEELWFHVDGAFGAFAALAPSLRSVVAGMSEADSVAVDLHKWGYLPFEVGLALVRHPDAHRATFATASSYLDATPRGVVAGGFPFADLGIQLSRGFRALKVWMSLKTHGADAWGRLVEQNVAQARHLRELDRGGAAAGAAGAGPAQRGVLSIRGARARRSRAGRVEPGDPDPGAGAGDRRAIEYRAQWTVRDPGGDHEPPEPAGGLRPVGRVGAGVGGGADGGLMRWSN